MDHITLYTEDRHRYVAELPEPRRSFLLEAVQAKLQEIGCADLDSALRDARASRVVDLEDTLSIHYLDRSPRLSTVHAIQHDELNSKIHDAQGRRGLPNPATTPQKDPPSK